MYIGYEKVNDTKARVTLIHSFPSELDQETLERGVIVEALPEPKTPGGKGAVLYINPQTKELWYEYVTLPTPEEDRISQLEIATEENKKANLDTQEAVLQLYEMVTGPQA
ncbi:hypothetical protein J31TS6_40550 [Brevibacillus reuszeri]|uniref:hypothetical protein n=1 Tax=Brevibacillus reuszeri TaxID=54915 RepID=UPI001B140018|nr:hypothetical protein [Brevibacillus reuszeri]GIO08027.1 hypothetical protein J31TS6_40550 [Brevibacillus reuszeri]